jgi:hypothetical protein
MKIAAASIRTLIRLAGLVLMVLGGLLWTGRVLDLTPAHAAIGVLFVLLLWTQALLAARAGLGAGIVSIETMWGLAILIFGMIQVRLLPGSAHWLIRVVHLLLGIGGIGLGEKVGARMERASR